MSIQINGVTYFSATEITQELAVSRQTLWRWRQEGKIPAGHRYRDRKILFTAHEAETIRQFANRIEPIDQPDLHQPDLFRGLNVAR
jgi:hypothetical protein